MPTMGAVTSAAHKTRPHQQHERGAARLKGTVYGHSPSFAKLHASATCAMLTPFLPASSSTLHTLVSKAKHVRRGATYRVTMSAVPAHVLYGPAALQEGQMSTRDCRTEGRY